jgi:hypothetical protein
MGIMSRLLRPIGLRSSVDRHVRFQRRHRYYFESNLVCYLHDLDRLHVQYPHLVTTPQTLLRSVDGQPAAAAMALPVNCVTPKSSPLLDAVL